MLTFCNKIKEKKSKKRGGEGKIGGKAIMKHVALGEEQGSSCVEKKNK